MFLTSKPFLLPGYEHDIVLLKIDFTDKTEENVTF